MSQKRMIVSLFAGLLLPGAVCWGQGAPAPPGQNMMLPPRWPVMTGTDPDAARVNPKPVRTTVEKLSSLRRPTTLPLHGPTQPIYRTLRVGPAEKTLWSVDAHIIQSQLNPDGDYHLVLRGAGGQRMICELPNPKLMPHPSPFAKQMTQARAALAARLHTTSTPQSCDVPARVTGLGYYGHVRPGDGGPENGLQLHPVVSVNFRSNALDKKQPPVI